MYYLFYDYSYILLVLPVVIFSLIMQARVNSVYNKYSKYRNSRNMTGAQVAERMLYAFGLHDVRIERVAGTLTDHFDPKAGVIRLSSAVYDSVSVAAAGVAAHECGHAMQFASGYGPIKLRSAMVPVCQIGSTVSPLLILIGFIMQWEPLIITGIIFFSFVALFQLVTLPVEFNASRRALATLEETGILSEEENSSARKVLNAAAMTYVAALAVSVVQILRLVLLFTGGRRKR